MLSISRSFGPGGGRRILAVRPWGVRLAGGGRLLRLQWEAEEWAQ